MVKLVPILVVFDTDRKEQSSPMSVKSWKQSSKCTSIIYSFVFYFHCIFNLTIKQRVIKRYFLLRNWPCKYLFETESILKTWLKVHDQVISRKLFETRAQALSKDNLFGKMQKSEHNQNWSKRETREVGVSSFTVYEFSTSLTSLRPIKCLQLQLTLIIRKEWLAPTKWKS